VTAGRSAAEDQGGARLSATGVGKTTSCAKIAAACRQVRRANLPDHAWTPTGRRLTSSCALGAAACAGATAHTALLAEDLLSSPARRWC
jgi:hypothetical protein